MGSIKGRLLSQAKILNVMQDLSTFNIFFDPYIPQQCFITNTSTANVSS